MKFSNCFKTTLLALALIGCNGAFQSAEEARKQEAKDAFVEDVTYFTTAGFIANECPSFGLNTTDDKFTREQAERLVEAGFSPEEQAEFDRSEFLPDISRIAFAQRERLGYFEEGLDACEFGRRILDSNDPSARYLKPI